MAAVEAAGNVDAKAGERQLPAVFGRYLLLKRLSRGGMGEIFLAKLGEIQGFEKLVIIKKILPNLGADQEFIKRFIDEAQVAIKLSHANIAPVFEVGKVDGEYFLAIEYVVVVPCSLSVYSTLIELPSVETVMRYTPTIFPLRRSVSSITRVPMRCTQTLVWPGSPSTG